MDEKGADSCCVRGGIQGVGVASRLSITPEECATPAPTTTGDYLPPALCNKVSAVPNELRIDAPRGLKRGFDLSVAVISTGKAPGRLCDEGPDRGDVRECCFAKRDAHLTPAGVWRQEQRSTSVAPQRASSGSVPGA